MSKQQRAWRSLAFAVAVAWGATGGAWALQVSPGRQELSVRPGHSKGIVIEVSNNSPDMLQIEVSEKNWFTLDENKNFPVETWLKIHGDRSFALKPDQGRKIHLTVKCPKGAQGELVGMVSFLYRTHETVMVTPIISVSVYVTAAGTEKVSGEITGIDLHYWQDKLQAAVSVKSTGNVHLRPVGKLTLLEAGGRELSTMQIAEAGPAYPGRVQAYIGSDPTTLKLKVGRYLAKAQLISRGVLMEASQNFEVSSDGEIKKAEEKH